MGSKYLSRNCGEKVTPVIVKPFALFSTYLKSMRCWFTEQKQANPTKMDLLIINSRNTQHTGSRLHQESFGPSMKCHQLPLRSSFVWLFQHPLGFPLYTILTTGLTFRPQGACLNVGQEQGLALGPSKWARSSVYEHKQVTNLLLAVCEISRSCGVGSLLPHVLLFKHLYCWCSYSLKHRDIHKILHSFGI